MPHVLRRDLAQRRIALAVETEVVVEPVGARGIFQFFVVGLGGCGNCKALRGRGQWYLRRRMRQATHGGFRIVGRVLQLVELQNVIRDRAVVRDGESSGGIQRHRLGNKIVQRRILPNPVVRERESRQRRTGAARQVARMAGGTMLSVGRGSICRSGGSRACQSEDGRPAEGKCRALPQALCRPIFVDDQSVLAYAANAAAISLAAM